MQEEDIEVLRKRMEQSTNNASRPFTRARKKVAQCLKTAGSTEGSNYKRTKTKDNRAMKLSKRASAVVQFKIPKKLDDPGSFSISCIIACMKFDGVMLDLGASVNILPSYLYAQMKYLGELKQTNKYFHLADKSRSYPLGYVEDIIVHVNHLMFPTDFYVIQMEEVFPDTCPILLGRPFMRTTKTKIDVYDGTISMAVDDDRIEFHPFQKVTTT